MRALKGLSIIEKHVGRRIVWHASEMLQGSAGKAPSGSLARQGSWAARPQEHEMELGSVFPNPEHTRTSTASSPSQHTFHNMLTWTYLHQDVYIPVWSQKAIAGGKRNWLLFPLLFVVIYFTAQPPKTHPDTCPHAHLYFNGPHAQQATREEQGLSLIWSSTLLHILATFLTSTWSLNTKARSVA